ncbi:MAG: hypothetical protein MUO64_21910, partial [Anaerolineales bacterium]|nr:hypothetical protein [Anaerolineales bacterium]
MVTCPFIVPVCAGCLAVTARGSTAIRLAATTVAPRIKMEDEMDIQVLVAYATKHGATAEIAEKIGQVLRQAGLRPDVLPANRVS